jgi:endo-1,4-beta-xylanase
MDVRIADGAGESELAQQANVYHDMLDACLALTRCVGLTTWGFTDRYSWITNPATRFSGFGRALPFDASYQPKPAYDALLARLEVP